MQRQIDAHCRQVEANLKQLSKRQRRQTYRQFFSAYLAAERHKDRKLMKEYRGICNQLQKIFAMPKGLAQQIETEARGFQDLIWAALMGEPEAT